MTNWFNNLDPMLQVYWCIAIFSSIVFTIQMAMSFIGGGDLGADTDVDISADVDVDAGGTDSMDSSASAFQLVSIRNIIYFLLGFSWAGVCLWKRIPNHIILIVASIAVGLLFVTCFVAIFSQLLKLQHNGAFDINDAIGKVCNVYLRIPANGQGMGKVQISLDGRVEEFDARTDSPDNIPTGSQVRVLQVIDRKVLVVELVSYLSFASSTS